MRVKWILIFGVGMAGCAARPAPVAPPGPNAGVVEQKPFLALNRWGNREGKPSVLLLQHARSDSPIPLSEYAMQPAHSLESFDLKPELSAARLRQKMGPPAQWADYADKWVVYRLTDDRELWLKFAEPSDDILLAADVVEQMEDGFSRRRVYWIGEQR